MGYIKLPITQGDQKGFAFIANLNVKSAIYTCDQEKPEKGAAAKNQMLRLYVDCPDDSLKKVLGKDMVSTEDDCTVLTLTPENCSIFYHLVKTVDIGWPPIPNVVPDPVSEFGPKLPAPEDKEE